MNNALNHSTTIWFFFPKNPVPQNFWLLVDFITSVSDLLDGFLGFKNPVPQFFWFAEFRTFVVLRLFLYGDYVRVKRVGANPLYNLPRRPRKWSRCDCLPPSFALNAPWQTSLFAMLTSLSCQHVADVAPKIVFIAHFVNVNAIALAGQ